MLRIIDSFPPMGVSDKAQKLRPTTCWALINEPPPGTPIEGDISPELKAGLQLMRWLQTKGELPITEAQPSAVLN